VKKRIIKFGSTEENSWIDIPKPAKGYIPQWYKDMDKFATGKPSLKGGNNGTMKLCLPTLDAFTTGYVVELWQDIEVARVIDENGQESVEIYWISEPAVVKNRHKAAAKTLPTPAGHWDLHFIWEIDVSIETPLGYSVIITHPFNRYDLPFTTMSGVIDTDTMPMGAGSLPFFLKKDFEGFIPKGTPLFQVIPFKREPWTSERDMESARKAELAFKKARSVAYGYYKKFGWNRKVYE